MERRYQEDFDGKLYITLRNERRDGYFHPSQLPRKLAPIADVLDPTSDIKAPTLRMLNRVPQHQRWLACLQACHDADTATPHPEVPHREAARFISVSQPTSAGVLDIAPDGTYSTMVENHKFSTYLQRRGGLNLSIAKAVCDAAEAAGEQPDRLGDRWSNEADHNRRHNSVLNNAYDAVTAVAIGQVVKGDKTDRDKMAALNEGTVSDLVELEGDEESGSDVHIEVKVPSPLTKSAKQKGRGTNKHGGTPTSNGHL